MENARNEPRMKRTQLRGQSGYKGEVRFVKHRAGVTDFWDLWEHDVVIAADGTELRTVRRDAKGWPIPRAENHVSTRTYKNKILKRGLGSILHQSLIGHPFGSSPYRPADITFPVGSEKNPFNAMFVAADDPTAIPPKSADVKVDWSESDGEFDNRVPLNPGVPGLGLRAILLSDTTGPGWKRNSIAYPTTAPYRQVEYTTFAQANTPTFAVGQIQVVAGASMVDGEWFELDDGINPVLRFEYDSNASVVEWDGNPANPIPIRFTGADTQTQVRDATIAEINRVLDYAELTGGGSLFITASAGIGAGDVDLDHDKGGAIGNVTIATSVAPAFTVSGMASGAGTLETPDDGIDNLPVKSMGLSAGVQCGDGEADAQIGIRTVLGLPAVIGPGKGRHTYVHEATVGTLHLYTGAETLGGIGTDGYVVDTEEEETEVAISTPNASDKITAATKRIRVVGWDLTRDVVGKAVRIASSGSGNDGDYTIASVLMKDVITVAEALTADEAGGAFTAEIVLLNRGDMAFDGDVTAEVAAGMIPDLGQKWRSQNSAGPHWIGRIWQTPKDVKAIRFIMPEGTPVGQAPDAFRFQFLDADKAPGGVPANLVPASDSYWTTIDTPFTTQGTLIYDGGRAGYLYEFTVPPGAGKCYGIRVYNLQAKNSTEAVEIAELYISTFTAQFDLTAGVDDVLRISTDGGSTWRNHALGDFSSADPPSSNDLVSFINETIRGYGVEAVAADASRLIFLRSTDNGDNVDLDLDTEGNGSTANSKLGFPSGGGTAAGTTQHFRKFIADPETIIYRAELSGDL